MSRWTPSRLRREGRNAFYPNGDAEDACPYVEKPYGNPRVHWIEGWKQSEKEYELSQIEPTVCECCGRELD